MEAWAGRGSTAADGGSAQECWTRILDAAAAHTSGSLAALLPAVLASRKYSPRLEVFSTLAAEGAPPPEV